MSDIPRVTGKPLAGPRARWDYPEYAISLSATLGVGNQDEISLGLSNAELSDLRCVRNYLVHPSKYTGEIYARIIRDRGLRGIGPSHYLRHSVAGGSTIFDGWVQNLVDLAWNAIA